MIQTSSFPDTFIRELGLDKKIYAVNVIKLCISASKMKEVIAFLMEFIESVCVSMILYFDKHSKDYRFIEAAMDEERTETKVCMHAAVVLNILTYFIFTNKNFKTFTSCTFTG